MGVDHPFLGNAFDQLILYLVDVCAGRHAGAVADAEDMRVDRHGRLAKCDVEDYVGGLAPYAGQFH